MKRIWSLAVMFLLVFLSSAHAVLVTDFVWQEVTTVDLAGSAKESISLHGGLGGYEISCRPEASVQGTYQIVKDLGLIQPGVKFPTLCSYSISSVVSQSGGWYCALRAYRSIPGMKIFSGYTGELNFFVSGDGTADIAAPSIAIGWSLR